MRELHALLDTATDRIDSPELVQVALRTAQRLRVHRRGAAAAFLASTLVAAVLVTAQLGREGTAGVPPAAPSTQSPSPDADTKPAPEMVGQVWPKWDPRDVEELPAASDRIAPALPEVIDPPASSPLLSDDPVSAAVAVVELGGVAQVLGVDGRWRTVPLEGTYPIPALSSDGTRLAVSNYAEHDVTVHDLATGASRRLEAPGALERYETTWEFSMMTRSWSREARRTRCPPRPARPNRRLMTTGSLAQPTPRAMCS